MGDVLPFVKSNKKKTKRRGMCQHNIHKWRVVTESRFDVKQGKLVTVYRCAHCDKEKTTAH